MWAIRQAHRAHMRRVRAWHRETRRRDWCLIKVVGSPLKGGYVYIWGGPGGTRRKCVTTHMSAVFVDTIWKSLINFRRVMAEELDDSDTPIGQQYQPVDQYFTV